MRTKLQRYFSDAVEGAKRNKGNIITSSLVVYAIFYFAIGLGGFSFQGQPATGYVSDPDQPSNPQPADESFIEGGPQAISVSAIYSDSDGHSGTLTFYERGTGDEIGSCSANDGERCGVDWSASHGDNWWYAVANDEGDDAATNSDDWFFTINRPPNKVTSPESPGQSTTVYSDSVELSAQVSDPDSDDLEATFYHNDSFSETTEMYASGSTASVSANNLNRGEIHRWWVDVSDGWNVTKSDEWEFYVNELPHVYNPEPEGIIVEDNPELSVSASDDNSDTLTAYFFNHSGDYIGKDTFSSGGQASTDYSSTTDVGETYEWKVNVSDGFENTTRTYTFTKTTSRSTRVIPRINYRYSSVIMPETGVRDIFFEVENRIDETKYLRTYISGVNAEFSENNQKSIEYTLEPESSEEFLVRIKPDSAGEFYLNLTTENQEFGLNTTESIPVTVKNYQDVSGTSEVSGIGTIQLLMLLLVSAYLYSVRL